MISIVGTDTTPLNYIFSDGTGNAFRDALSEAFSFAYHLEHECKQKRPNHKLEIWDQAVSFQLGNLAESSSLFIEGTKLYLEKDHSEIVWKCGYNVLESHPKDKRLWVLPDGIIKIKDETIIIVEFDHGDTIGEWANQLLKALRILASGKVQGVLYCFCLEKDIQNPENEKLTKEFQSLIVSLCGNKKLGIITLRPSQSFDKKEAKGFFEKVYLKNQNISPQSREEAEKLVEACR